MQISATLSRIQSTTEFIRTTGGMNKVKLQIKLVDSYSQALYSQLKNKAPAERKWLFRLEHKMKQYPPSTSRSEEQITILLVWHPETRGVFGAK